MATAVDTAEVLLYGVIGDEISERDFRSEMDYCRQADEINIRISSGGGNVFAGVGMITAIREAQARGQYIRTYNDGACFSMAAIIFQTGDRRIMADSSMLMLHNPFSSQGGDAKELRRTADALDKVKSNLVDLVVKRSGQPRDTVDRWFEYESWFSVQEALAYNLADLRYIDRNQHAHHAAHIFAKYTIPERYTQQFRAPIEAALKEIDLDGRIALGCTRWEPFCTYRENAIRRAGKLIEMQACAPDDTARALVVLDRIEERKNDIYYW